MSNRIFQSPVRVIGAEERQLAFGRGTGSSETNSLPGEGSLQKAIKDVRVVKPASSVAVVASKDNDLNAVTTTYVAGAGPPWPCF
jgi:hypothetical protein